MESSLGTQKFKASSQMRLYLTAGRSLLLRPASISLFGMPLLNHYLKLLDKRAWTEVPGASPFFYYTSLCFSLPKWYILYFGAFTQNLKNLAARPSASGDEAHSCSAPLGSHLMVSLSGGRWGHFSRWQDFGRASSPAPKFWQQDQLTSLRINLMLFCEALKDSYMRFLTTLIVL